MPDLPNKPALLMDGATGTELMRRGFELTKPLWSARAILDAPDLIEQIHREYLEAGAEAIITNSFRTHERSLAKAGLGDRAEELTAQAVAIAEQARQKINPDALIFGSVAPLEDCYHPESVPSEEACHREHGQIMRHLMDAGVDYLIIETMNTLREASAAAEEAEQCMPCRWMMSCCTRSIGPPGVLLSGEPLVDLLPQLQNAAAVGVNCVAAPQVESQVRLLRQLLPETIRIMAYANVSWCNETGDWVDSDAKEPEKFADHAVKWIEAGAGIIGGCCGTTPDTIRAINTRLPQA